MFVNIGGIEQWIEIGGTGADKPVLLVRHRARRSLPT